MGWLTGALAVLRVIERAIPIAESLIGPKRGLEKANLVTQQAEAVLGVLLPQINVQDPRLQAALQQKIAADVALQNLLQHLQDPPMTTGTVSMGNAWALPAEQPGTPVPDTSTLKLPLNGA